MTTFSLSDISITSLLYILLTILILIAIVFLLISCSQINKALHLPDENPLQKTVETIVDDVVIHETGINPHLDLTPGAAQQPAVKADSNDPNQPPSNNQK